MAQTASIRFTEGDGNVEEQLESQLNQLKTECLSCSQILKHNQKLNPLSLYNHILCQECENGMTLKDRQVEIFSKLIEFFEPKQVDHSNPKLSANSSTGKMKIKDLIRLVMHVLNEVSGLTLSLHSCFPELRSTPLSHSLLLPNLNTTYNQESSEKIHQAQIPLYNTQPQSFPNPHSINTNDPTTKEHQQFCETKNSSQKATLATTPTQRPIQTNNKLFERRLNATQDILNMTLKEQPSSSSKNKQVACSSERRARTESDETDEFDIGILNMAPQIRRHSMKSKNLFTTQPLIKLKGFASANLSQKNSIQITHGISALLDESHSFFTHPSPSAKHNQSRNNQSILSSTNCISGSSDFLVQPTQIEIQLDGSFNDKEFSKSIFKQLPKRSTSLLDSSQESDAQQRKNSFPQIQQDNKQKSSGTIKIKVPRIQVQQATAPRSMECNNLITSFDKMKKSDDQHASQKIQRSPNRNRSCSPPLQHNQQQVQKEKSRSNTNVARSYFDQNFAIQSRTFHPRSQSSLQGSLNNDRSCYNVNTSRASISNTLNIQEQQSKNSSSFESKTKSKMKVTSAQERSIIKGIMKEIYGDNCQNGFHKCKHIIQFTLKANYFILYYMSIEDHGVLNEAKFIINGEWWRNWLEYVGYNEIGAINRDDNRSRPNQMHNSVLLKQRQINETHVNNYFLKDELLEHYDYEAIPQKLFEKLNEWYQIDYQIVRFLKYDPSKACDNQVYLDIYPEKSLGLTLPSGARRKQANANQANHKERNVNTHNENNVTSNKDDNSSKPEIVLNKNLSNSVLCHADEKSSACNIF